MHHHLGPDSVGEGTLPVGEGYQSVGEGNRPVGEGTPPVGEGTPPVGQGNQPAAEGTVGQGRVPADLGDMLRNWDPRKPGVALTLIHQTHQG